MEISELKNLIARQEELGLDCLVLKMPEPKSWRKNPPMGNRVRSPFGLCAWGGFGHDGNIVIWPSLKQVKAYIAKAENEVFYQIGVHRENRQVFVVSTKMKLLHEVTEKGIELVGKRFKFKWEAEECVAWALSQLTPGNDQEP